MDNQQGFSLIEVLIALMLMTVSVLGMMSQQWQNNQFFNQIQRQTDALAELDNAAEYWQSHHLPMPSDHLAYPLQLHYQKDAITIDIKSSWQGKTYHLTRTLLKV